MEYVYWFSEPGLWTVGYIDANGKKQPESDHNSTQEAAARVNYLNGGSVAVASSATIAGQSAGNVALDTAIANYVSEVEDATIALGCRLPEAYKALADATQKYHNSTQIEIACKDGYEKAKAVLLLRHADNPKELGANEEARNAAIKVKLWEECDTLAKAAGNVAQARHELTIAQLAVDSLRTQLRCFEVIAALGGNKND